MSGNLPGLGAAALGLSVLIGAAVMLPPVAVAGCVAVNGSALGTLASNETVNCTGAESNVLKNAGAATHITINLLPGGSIISAAGGTPPAIDLGNFNVVRSNGGLIDTLAVGGAGIQLNDNNVLYIDNSTLRAANSEAVIVLHDMNAAYINNSTLRQVDSDHAGIKLNLSNAVYLANSTIQAAHFGINGDDGIFVSLKNSEIDVEDNGVSLDSGTSGQINLTNSKVVTTGDGSRGLGVRDHGFIGIDQGNLVIGGNNSVGVHLSDHAETFINDSSIVAPGSGTRGIEIGDNGIVNVVNSNVVAASGIVAGDTASIGITDSTITATTGDGISETSPGVLSPLLGITNSTISAAAGRSVNLGAADDRLLLRTGAHLNSLNGAWGGVGANFLYLEGTGSEDEVFHQFGQLQMLGADWALSGTSTFNSILVSTGRLRINGDLTASTSAQVNAGAIIGGNGNLTTPTLTVQGMMAPGNSVGTLIVTGNYVQNGGAFEAQFDQSGIDRLNVTGTATLQNNPALVVVPTGAAGGATGIFLHANGGITGTFGAMQFQGNGGATVVYNANNATLFTAQPTGAVADDVVGLGFGEHVLSILGDEQLQHLGRNERKLWATGIGYGGSHGASGGNAGYDELTGGGLIGSDLYAKDGWHFGIGAGYGRSTIDIDQQAGDSQIDSALGLGYASYQRDTWFALGRVIGGWQHVNDDRAIAQMTDSTSTSTFPNTTNDLVTAEDSSHAWLLGGGISFGARLPFQDGWTLTPRINADVVKQWHGAAHEHGTSGGEIDVGAYGTAAFTGSANLRLARLVSFDNFAVEPFLQIGVARRIAFGDQSAKGSFQATGDSFDIALDQHDSTIGLISLGALARFGNGIEAHLNYAGQFARNADVHGVTANLRLTW
jgi:uncharacterized protein with beta-barrel porin domain